MPKLYGYTEGDAQRIRKTVLNDERTKTLAPWRHTPILNGENDEYTGPFAVRIIEKEGKAGEDSKLMLSVNGGYVNGNGIHIEMIEGAELELSAGYVCVHLGIDAQGNWQTPEFVVTAEPTVNDYPVFAGTVAGWQDLSNTSGARIACRHHDIRPLPSGGILIR